jgi:hypothetical protein
MGEIVAARIPASLEDAAISRRHIRIRVLPRDQRLRNEYKKTYRPCFKAPRRGLSLPASVLGPVEGRLLRRFAVI